MRFDGFAAMPKCFRAAALALPIALGPGAPAAAEPTLSLTDPIDVAPNQHTVVPATAIFSDFGTNATYTSVTFSTTEYLDTSRSGVGTLHGSPSLTGSGGHLSVTVLTNDELNALDPKPPSPFTFTADVALTNSEGETASTTLTFQTAYVVLSPPEEAAEEARTVGPCSHAFEHESRSDGLFLNWNCPTFIDIDKPEPQSFEAEYSWIWKPADRDYEHVTGYVNLTDTFDGTTTSHTFAYPPASSYTGGSLSHLCIEITTVYSDSDESTGPLICPQVQVPAGDS